MATVQRSTSLQFATGLLDAWDRADLARFTSHLAQSEGLERSNDVSTLEGERRELVSGIAVSLKKAMDHKPSADLVEEMDTSLDLLRHLVRMQMRHVNS